MITFLCCENFSPTIHWPKLFRRKKKTAVPLELPPQTATLVLNAKHVVSSELLEGTTQPERCCFAVFDKKARYVAFTGKSLLHEGKGPTELVGTIPTDTLSPMFRNVFGPVFRKTLDGRRCQFIALNSMNPTLVRTFPLRLRVGRKHRVVSGGVLLIQPFDGVIMDESHLTSEDAVHTSSGDED